MRQITNPRHHEELCHRVFGVNFLENELMSHDFRLPFNAGFRLVDEIETATLSIHVRPLVL